MIKIILLMLLISLSSHAGLTDDMNDFFESAGIQTNVTGAGAYKGQMAGLYTGGQLYARNQVKMIYPASIRLPSFSAGCGGIDAFTGSFSFISGDELKNSMEAIASNATSYAFMLAMETVSPQISGVQKHLSGLINAVNRANINSCEAASTLVGGLWDKSEMALNKICASAGASGGFLSDWDAAKQGCGKGKTAEILEAEKTKETYGDTTLYNKNIAWETIKKSRLNTLDTQTKEMLMAISGTIIVKNGEPEPLVTLPSDVTNRNFIKALLNGGDTSVIQCDEIKLCLKPEVTKITISEEESFNGMVVKMLNGIRDAMIAGASLNDGQINFLGSTSLPIYKMFNVEYAINKDVDILNINSYSEIIATDMLFQYLSENLEMMLAASRSVDLGEGTMKEYRDSLHRSRAYVDALRNETKSTINHTMHAIKQTQVLEQVLAGKLSSHLVNVINAGNGA